MPNYFRLLGVYTILTTGVTCGILSAATPNPAPATEHESIKGGFPFNNQDIPSATTTSPAVSTTANAKAAHEPVPATIVESQKMGNNQCAKPAENHLQKAVLLVAFPKLTPNIANAGELSLVEQQVPELIAQQLVNKHNAVVPAKLDEGLALPGASSDIQLAMQVQKLARTHNAQIVVSGEIMDMSMAHPEATYNPSLYRRFVNGVLDLTHFKTRFDKRDRLFSFQLHVRDGFTGQQLFTRRYDTYGIWAETRPIGFGSEPFWKTDYGQQIKGLIKRASQEVGDVLECQPFIAHVDYRPGQTQVILQGGANNGLHAGDMLSLYQLVIEGSETVYQQHEVRMVNRNAGIELREVYPSHSVGVVNSSTYMMGQFLAVAP